jgi:serine/threonine protein kinase
MITLDHPNISKIFEFFWAKDKKHVSVVMEILEGGELEDHLKAECKLKDKLDEQYVASIMKQLLQALKYCH